MSLLTDRSPWDQPLESGSVRRDDAIAGIGEPDEGAMTEECHQRGMPANFPEREKHRAATGKLAAITGDDLHGPPRLDPQQRGHRWSGRYLPGADAKPALAVSQDEPGSPFATKLAIAIEEQLVLGSVGHGCKDS